VKGSETTTFLSATFAVVAPGFIAKGMTIRNTAGAEGEQAVALRAGGDQQAFSNVNLEGYQDTLYAHTLRQFYSGCTIIGTIDYIFGNAAAVFQNCNLQARLGQAGSQNIYSASGRTDPGQNTGLSFLSCTVGAAPGLPDSYPTYLGRPWKPYAQTVFIKSTLANCVNPAGWLLWNGDPNSGKTVNYGEYGNTGPGANTASRVSWSRQISVTEATKFTVSSFIAGQEWLPATSIPFNSAL
jgi:pectinesterase